MQDYHIIKKKNVNGGTVRPRGDLTQCSLIFVEKDFKTHTVGSTGLPF